MTRSPQSFFDQRGVESKGDVIEIGRVARIGALSEHQGEEPSTFAPLAPAGQLLVQSASTHPFAALVVTMQRACNNVALECPDLVDVI